MHSFNHKFLVSLATAVLAAALSMTVHEVAADTGPCGSIEFNDGTVTTGKALPAVVPLDATTRACLVAIGAEVANRPFVQSLAVIVRAPDNERLADKGKEIGAAMKQALVEGGAPASRVSPVSQAVILDKPAIELHYRERRAGLPIAKVVRLDGHAENGLQLQALQPTETGTPIGKHEYLSTDTGARAINRLADGSQFRLEPSSLVRFSNVTLTSDYKRDVELEVIKGTVNTIATHQAGSSFRLVTKAAVAGVKGTKFRTTVADDGTTRIEVQDGKVELGNEQATVQVTAGYGSKVRPGSAPEEPRKLLPMAIGQRPLRGTFPSPPALSWQPVAGASGYIVLIAGNAEFTRQVMSVQVPSGTTLTPSASLDQQKWFWRVQAVDADGFIGMPSKIFTFDVQANPASAEPLSEDGNSP